MKASIGSISGIFLCGLSSVVCGENMKQNMTLPATKISGFTAGKEHFKDDFQNIGPELKIKLTHWTPDNIRKSVQQLGATGVCATFSISAKGEFDEMQKYVDAINNNFFAIATAVVISNLSGSKHSPKLSKEVKAALVFFVKNIESLGINLPVGIINTSRTLAKNIESTEKSLPQIKSTKEALNILSSNAKSLGVNLPQNLRDSLMTLSGNVQSLRKSYKRCYKELPLHKSTQEFAFTTCIGHLKELQEVVQDLRNIVDNISNQIRALTEEEKTKGKNVKYSKRESAHSKENSSHQTYQGLRDLKEQIRAISSNCSSLIELSDIVIDNLKNLLDIYHQYSNKERNSGIYATELSRRHL